MEIMNLNMSWADIDEYDRRLNKYLNHKNELVLNQENIILINLIDLFDGDKRLILTNEVLDELTKIIIGKKGYYLKKISNDCGINTIWCKTDTNLNEYNLYNRYFELTFKEYNDNQYSYNLAYWMLKKRVNEVIYKYLQNNNY
tara:strand:+ start:2180 stop:2608 length:429 start_codon:yes stop_codon:yes gene_type:complete